MNSLKSQIPNLFTLGNLLSGCFAIVAIAENQLVYASYLVGLAAVLDFFDGFLARLLKVSGELGKQLDSLADMVTFGVVPGYMMYTLLNDAMLRNWILHNPDGLEYNQPFNYLAFIAFIITLMSGYRLAKFNIDTRQSHSFIGLPTPANALFFCSFPLIQKMAVPAYEFISNGDHSQMVTVIPQGALLNTMNNIISYNAEVLIALILLFSYLMIAELPLMALKFKSFGFTENKMRYLLILCAAVLLIIFQFAAIPFIVFLYIILSVINNLFLKS